MTTDEMLRDLRQRIYALRNGVIADVYRKAGDPHEVVMGLQLPQISGLAREVRAAGADVAEIRRRLWSDRKMRETRLLACYLTDPERGDLGEAAAMAGDCMTQEEADVLSMRLLRRMADREALEAALQADGGEGSLRCLTALRR